ELCKSFVDSRSPDRDTPHQAFHERAGKASAVISLRLTRCSVTRREPQPASGDSARGTPILIGAATAAEPVAFAELARTVVAGFKPRGLSDLYLLLRVVHCQASMLRAARSSERSPQPPPDFNRPRASLEPCLLSN